mmetsp:Transcript_19713/g.53222  ORF Transcript_19713/g.53222 Transcript_19713/m.53222 type:complete len:203 (-) Transcript_19713:188-796(-)
MRRGGDGRSAGLRRAADRHCQHQECGDTWSTRRATPDLLNGVCPLVDGYLERAQAAVLIVPRWSVVGLQQGASARAVANRNLLNSQRAVESWERIGLSFRDFARRRLHRPFWRERSVEVASLVDEASTTFDVNTCAQRVPCPRRRRNRIWAHHASHLDSALWLLCRAERGDLCSSLSVGHFDIRMSANVARHGIMRTALLYP